LKKKLLVLLGAGSSVDQDFPSTGKLDDEVAGWAAEWSKRKPPDPVDSMDQRTRTNFYDRLWTNRTDYCAGLAGDQRNIVERRTRPNYERVLGDLHALMNGVLPKPFGDPILKWIPRADVFSKVGIAPETGVLDQNDSNKVFHAVLAQLQTLCNRLAARIRGQSNLFGLELANGRGTTAFAPYRQLMGGLAREFDLGVYNLNYDSVALHALPDSFVGFDRSSGVFQAAEVLGRMDWGFLYHLHGSIHHWIKDGNHTMEKDDFGPKIIWQDDLSLEGIGEDWQDSLYLATQSDEKRVLLTSLIAGGWKLDQLQEEPFLTLYSCLPRHVQEADAILIGGYGFGDSHINSILRNAIRAKANRRKRPPVLVLDYNPGRQPVAQRVDAWSVALRATLRVPPQSFRSPANRAKRHFTKLPAKLPPRVFERSNRAPVAIWNGGFTAAAKQLAKIVPWLDGDESAL
jgi:hypothetical protein